MHNKMSDLSKYDLGIHIFNIEAEKYLLDKNYGSYRNALYHKSIIYHSIQDNKKELELLLQICYIDLSGFSNTSIINKNLAFLTPAIISAIKTNDYFNIIDREEFDNLLITSINKLPFNFDKTFYGKFCNDIYERLF